MNTDFDELFACSDNALREIVPPKVVNFCHPTYTRNLKVDNVLLITFPLIWCLQAINHCLYC